MLGRSQRCNLEEGAERQGCRSLLSIGGIICNFTPTLPYIQHWGMNVDHDFFQVSKLSEDQKKRSSPKMEHFFPRIQVKTKKKRSSPKMEHFFPRIQVKTKKKGFHQNWNTFFPRNSSGDLRSDANQSQIIGGCSYRPYSNYWGGHFPTYPPGFRHPC